jgi:hypothetical protein
VSLSLSLLPLAQATAPTWLSLALGLPGGLGFVGGLFGSIIDIASSSPPPVSGLDKWRDFGALVGGMVGILLYPVALVAIYN